MFITVTVAFTHRVADVGAFKREGEAHGAEVACVRQHQHSLVIKLNHTRNRFNFFSLQNLDSRRVLGWDPQHLSVLGSGSKTRLESRVWDHVGPQGWVGGHGTSLLVHASAGTIVLGVWML